MLRSGRWLAIIVTAGALAWGACGTPATPVPATAVPMTAQPATTGTPSESGSSTVSPPQVATVQPASAATPPAVSSGLLSPVSSSSSSSPTVTLTSTPTPSPTPAPTPTPTATPSPTPTPTPTSTPTATPTPGDDTPPTTTAGCDLAVNIGLLETIPGKYQVSIGLNSVGGASCPAPTTLSLSVSPSGALSFGPLGLAYEYNGTASWSCSGTTCTAAGTIPGNPPGTMYQVGFQTMATLSGGSAQLCATVANGADANAANDSWCETVA
ncbi:MAG: hypothetical protein J7448_09755 [Thermomicrobium sp.]|nr:hypothetical protein [Thermomicrobium sp.]